MTAACAGTEPSGSVLNGRTPFETSIRPGVPPEDTGGPFIPATDCGTLDIDYATNGIVSEDRAVGNLSSLYVAIVTALGALPANAYFQGPDGTRVAVAELYDLFRRLDFAVVPTSTDLGGASSVVSPTPDGLLITVRMSTLLHFMRTPGDASYLDPISWILHELSHGTREGRERWDQVLASPGGQYGAASVSNEQWINRMAHAIRTAMGLPASAVLPPLGFGDAAMPSLVTPTGDEGPTAEQAFEPCGG